MAEQKTQERNELTPEQAKFVIKAIAEVEREEANASKQRAEPNQAKARRPSAAKRG
jgi:hypothetical protein